MNKGLTSFRAFAFIAVYFHHLNYEAIGGYLGVQAFFVLSGFLLTPILYEMKNNFAPGDYFFNFYGRRALRIFPLYYTFLLISAIFFYFLDISQPLTTNSAVNETIEKEIEGVFGSLGWHAVYAGNFLQSLSSWKQNFSLAPLWSLAVEEQFYLIWPILLLAVPAKYAKPFLLLTILITPFLRWAFMHFAQQGVFPNVHQNWLTLSLYTLPFTFIDAFAIGGLFAMYVKSKPKILTWLAILVVLAAGYISEYISVGSIRDYSSFGYSLYMNDSYKFIWGYTLVSLLFAFILVQVKDGKFCRPIFENPVFYYLGKISYGMYIFHALVLWCVYRLLPGSSNYMVGAVAFPFVVLISVLSYELMEKRFIGLKDKYFPKESNDKNTKEFISPPMPSKKIYPRIFLGSISLLFTISISTFVFTNFITPVIEDETDKSLRRLSLEINKQLPKMETKETRLDSTVSENKTFRYNYTLVRYDAKNIDKQTLESAFKPRLINNFCNTGMKTFFAGLDTQVPVIYTYFSNDGIQITDIVITSDLCP